MIRTELSNEVFDRLEPPYKVGEIVEIVFDIQSKGKVVMKEGEKHEIASVKGCKVTVGGWILSDDCVKRVKA